MNSKFKYFQLLIILRNKSLNLIIILSLYIQKLNWNKILAGILALLCWLILLFILKYKRIG